MTSTSTSIPTDNRNNKESQNVVPYTTRIESESRKRLTKPSDPRLRRTPRTNPTSLPAVREENTNGAVVVKMQENVQKIADKQKRLNTEEVGIGVEKDLVC